MEEFFKKVLHSHKKNYKKTLLRIIRKREKNKKYIIPIIITQATILIVSLISVTTKPIKGRDLKALIKNL